MKIFPKRKTDVEYMKGVVSLYNKRWYFFFVGLIISIIIFSCTYYFANKFDKQTTAIFKDMKFDNKQSDKEHNENIDKIQYVLGAKLGYALSGGVYLSILGFILSMNAIFNHRKDKLLIDLYKKSEKHESST